MRISDSILKIMTRVGLLAGALLSGTIEFAQLFLPGRISSNLDILSNAAGSLLRKKTAARQKSGD